MDVLARRERLLEVLVARHVGEDPQLDLAVVGGQEGHVGRAGHEGPPDPPAERRVRIGMFWRFGSEDERRPVAATAWWNVVWRRPSAAEEARQRLDVRAAQLGVEPPVEELADHRVRRAQLLEDRRVGRVAGLRPLALRQVQLVEEDLLQLLGAAQVELVADVGVDLRLQAGDLRRELAVEEASASRSRATPVASMRARTGMSGSSISAKRRSRPWRLERRRERRPHGERGERLEAARSPGPQAGRGRRQVEVEPLVRRRPRSTGCAATR